MRTSSERARVPGAPAARLLPWAGEGGRRCYVVGNGTGRVSRMADDVESIQLDMADELLGHADDLLGGAATGDQVRFLAGQLTESLRQVVRVAESRGTRLEALLPEEPAGAEVEEVAEAEPGVALP
ncbi:hypothetical protein [Streptomyces californicus]|uniref:hypothetical protein n=1 Tax=Streptomyces californicus TaxID=67351 RepID=UPI0036813147